MKLKGNRKLLTVGLAVFCLLATAAVSAAYWTDKIEIKTSVDAMNIGIEYHDNAISLKDNKTTFQPGESREFGFTVDNTGSISVDIKPVITLSADKPMTKNGSVFKIVDSEGKELEGFTAEYFDEGGNVVDGDNNAAFTKVRYMLDNQITLAGSAQKDAVQREVNESQAFTYYLKLAETTGNEFVNAHATMDVSTYAIQHRFRGSGEERWLEFPAAVH